MFKLHKIVLICLIIPMLAIAHAENSKLTEIGGTMNYRKINEVTKGRGQHWVGNGFPVVNMFSYRTDEDISPFLLLDYAKPTNFSPSDSPRGVEQHPHRGFETVTIVYDGELQHKDTAGNHGVIGPGDVQWMTAAHGILHEEMHSDEFTRKGGRLEMVQLWVNLPAKDKMSQPHYQEIKSSNIPVVAISENKGCVRVIAGKFGDTASTVKTFTPVHLYDIRMQEETSLNIPVVSGYNAILLVLEGTARVDNKKINPGELVKFSNNGDMIALTALSNIKVLFMAGEPIDEPIVGAGPFVMNTEAEIRQAYNDYQSGKFLN
jgi:redox-sensitive bicupin YhaK (pirin superfamily)